MRIPPLHEPIRFELLSDAYRSHHQQIAVEQAHHFGSLACIVIHLGEISVQQIDAFSRDQRISCTMSYTDSRALCSGSILAYMLGVTGSVADHTLQSSCMT